MFSILFPFRRSFCTPTPLDVPNCLDSVPYKNPSCEPFVPDRRNRVSRSTDDPPVVSAMRRDNGDHISKRFITSQETHSAVNFLLDTPTVHSLDCDELSLDDLSTVDCTQIDGTETEAAVCGLQAELF